MADVILAHTEAAATRAARVAEKLRALGYQVRTDFEAAGPLSPHARRRRAAAIDSAACFVVLWSKDAAEAPALLEAAARAKAAGKLMLARLDAASPPLRLKALDLSSWSGRDTRPWRAFAARIAQASGRGSRRRAAPAERRAAPTPSPRAPQAARAKQGGAGPAIAFAAALALMIAGAAGVYVYASAVGLPPEIAAALPPQLTNLLTR